MPIYTYSCAHCNTVEDVLRIVSGRNAPYICGKCSNFMIRQPELFRPDTFEPYFDEGLGSDVHSRADKKRIMNELGVIEAGDRVHGGINFDKHAPSHVGKHELKGLRRPNVPESDEQIVEVVDSNDVVLDKVKLGDIPSTGVEWSEK